MPKPNIIFTKNKAKGSEPTRDLLSYNQGEIVLNAIMARRDLLSTMIDPRRDLNKDCGYPIHIETSQYREFIERHGIANRVNTVFPEESWKRNPDIYETEKGEKTEWEMALEEVNVKASLLHYMERIDILSGHGHYGVLFIGVNDGRTLDQPIQGIEETGEVSKIIPKDRKITFLRCFTEELASIDSFEEDTRNPRYGQPKFYTLKFSDPRLSGDQIVGSTFSQDVRVHWSRVIHIADNRTTSEIIGQPRLKNVFNYLQDMQKILSGSGEMFWKGGFPGYSFEVPPEALGQVEVDKDSMRKEMEAFSNSLQRYMALVGVTAKSLAPQVADPRPHMEAQMDAICIAKGIPKRIFMGSEQAQLASTQDKKTWNERLAHRQNFYLTPMLVRPVIDRLMAIGVLPRIEKYFVEWPEIFGPTDDEQATTAFKKTQSIAAYVGSGSENLIPPLEYLTMVLNFSSEEAQAIINAADKHVPQFNDALDVGGPPKSQKSEVDRGHKKTANPK